jgi:hypothetical protein
MNSAGQSVRLNEVENPARFRWSHRRSATGTPTLPFLCKRAALVPASASEQMALVRNSSCHQTDRKSRIWPGFLASLPARGLLGLIWLYRHSFSPVLPVVCGPGCGCRFHPTCAWYAADAVRTYGAVRGSWLAVRRLLKCHPWHPGGFDPIPGSPMRGPILSSSFQSSRSAGPSSSPSLRLAKPPVADRRYP